MTIYEIQDLIMPLFRGIGPCRCCRSQVIRHCLDNEVQTGDVVYCHKECNQTYVDLKGNLVTMEGKLTYDGRHWVRT